MFASLLVSGRVAEVTTEPMLAAGRISPRTEASPREGLVGRVVRLALRCSGEGAMGPVVVRFQEGWLQGVVCRIEVVGGEVRCRLRCDGAPSRRRLRSYRASIAGRLQVCGLSLRFFEVSS